MNTSTFPKCGHPRTPENTWSCGANGKGSRCATCGIEKAKGKRPRQRELGDGVTTYRACGHPKTPENSWSLGNGYMRCKQCHQARKKSYRSRTRAPEEYIQFRRPSRVKLDLSNDPAVQLYREEKARWLAKNPPAPHTDVVDLGEHRPFIPRYWGAIAS